MSWITAPRDVFEGILQRPAVHSEKVQPWTGFRLGHFMDGVGWYEAQLWPEKALFLAWGAGAPCPRSCPHSKPGFLVLSVTTHPAALSKLWRQRVRLLERSRLRFLTSITPSRSVARLMARHIPHLSDLAGAGSDAGSDSAQSPGQPLG